MNEPKHTPGPWKMWTEYPYQDEPNLPYQHFIAGRGYYGEGFDMTGICSVLDAKLIAAAPDLLEACRHIDSYPEINLNNYDETDVIALHQWANDLVVAADAAIRKATQ